MTAADILIMLGIVGALVVGPIIGTEIGIQIERRRYMREVPTLLPSKKETHL